MTRHELIQEAYKVGVVRWDVAEELVDLICEAEREACVQAGFDACLSKDDAVRVREAIRARGNP
jgi:hypothetical protein